MGQSPKIDSVLISSDSVELYGKVEISLKGNFSFSNPYDYDQIKVRGEFEGPGGVNAEADGFFMESYEFVGANGAIQKNGKDGFYLRFAPTRTGQWRFRLGVEDAIGKDTSAWYDFVCTNPTTVSGKGFLEVGTSNYLKFNDGTPFIPIGHNLAWPNGNAFANYTNWLTALKANAGNYFRLWHCHWGLSLEWLGNGYGGLKDYHQANAFYLDWLHDYCAQNGIYTMLCLQHHGQVSTQVNPNWSGSPYNVANGGMCPNTLAFFTDSLAISTTKNRLRYIVARWGYNPSIMAWELFNEVNWTDNFVQNAGGIADWHAEMASFLRELDPNKRLITTSLAEENQMDLFFTLPDLDISQNHNYQSTPRIEQVLARASKHSLQSYDKPTLNGEFGISIGGSNLGSLDPDGIHLHNGLWGGFFGGGLGTAGSWWWDNYIDPRGLYYHYKGFAALVERVSFEEKAYSPTQSYTTGDGGALDLIPNLGWGVVGDDSIEISPNGQVSGSANLSEYLYGSTWNTQFRSPPTFFVEYASLGELTIGTGANKGQDPQIVVWVDGTKVLDEAGNTNTNYQVAIPAGQHVIKVDNTGTDWISISSYSFSGLGSPLASYVLAAATGDELTAWLLNPAYNHVEVSGADIPDPVLGSQLFIPQVQNGFYMARWYNCLTGALEKVDSVQVSNDTLVLPIPPVQWDLGLVVDQNFTLSNEALAQGEVLRVFPNPAKSGGSIRLSGSFGASSEEAWLLDVHGRIIQTWQIEAWQRKEDTFQLEIPNGLSRGHYWLVLGNGKRKESVQILIGE